MIKKRRICPALFFFKDFKVVKVFNALLRRSFCSADYESKTLAIMKKYVCTACDWVYDPEVGDPDGGIPAGTPFEEIPDDWTCPVCGVGKDDFRPVD